MKSYLYAFLFLVLCVWQTVGFAVGDAQLESIRKLGELNGIALHCKALAETQRMKKALVLNLPKRRQLGELFDQETNRSFLDFINNRAACPSLGAFTQQVDAAISDLERVFSKQ